MKNIFFALLAITTLVFAGCDKEGDGESNAIRLTSSDQTMYYGDEFQINATSDTPITYTSESEYHAEVSASGLVTAGRVGQTNIVLTNGEDTKRIKITVRPQSNLYPEPDLTFGMSRSAVKAKLGTPDAETEDAIRYDDYSSNAPQLACLFDEVDKLSSYAVLVKTSYSSQLGDFLAERYVAAIVDPDEEVFLFLLNALDPYDATMSIGVSIYNLSYFMVLYAPVSSTTTRSRSAVEHAEIMKSMNEIMNK